MSFVKEKFCYGCKNFVLESTKNHVCIQKNVLDVQKPETTFIGTSLKSIPVATTYKASSSLFDSLSDIESEDQSPPVQLNSSTEQKLSIQDMAKLITLVETSRPLWNYKMALGERSETIKKNLWNYIFVQFNGKYSIDGLKRAGNT